MTDSSAITLSERIDRFLAYLKLRDERGELCERCHYRSKQKDGNIYCFDCMCDLETSRR